MNEEGNDDYRDLIDVGVFILHVVHRSFRADVQKIRWGIDALLKTMCNLFDDCPAKERTTELSNCLMSFHYHSMVTDG